MSSPLAPAPQLFHLIPRHFVNVPSRPLWYTVDQTPVLILGGIPEEKAILLTDTNFKDFFLVEVVEAAQRQSAQAPLLPGVGGGQCSIQGEPEKPSSKQFCKPQKICPGRGADRYQ